MTSDDGYLVFSPAPAAPAYSRFLSEPEEGSKDLTEFLRTAVRHSPLPLEPLPDPDYIATEMFWPLSDLRHSRARTLPLVDMTWEDAGKAVDLWGDWGVRSREITRTPRHWYIQPVTLKSHYITRSKQRREWHPHSYDSRYIQPEKLRDVAAFFLTADEFRFRGRVTPHGEKVRAAIGLARQLLAMHLEHLNADMLASEEAFDRPLRVHIADWLSFGSVPPWPVLLLSVAGEGDGVPPNELAPSEAETVLADLRERVANRAIITADAMTVARDLRDGVAVEARKYVAAFSAMMVMTINAARLANMYDACVVSMPAFGCRTDLHEPEAFRLFWPWGRDREPMPNTVVLPGVLSNRAVAAARQIEKAKRRTEALRLVGEGLSLREVARQTGLSKTRIAELAQSKLLAELGHTGSSATNLPESSAGPASRPARRRRDRPVMSLR